MKTEKKTFDAVRTMREIRDALSREIAGLSYEEQRRLIEERLKEGAAPAPQGQQELARGVSPGNGNRNDLQAP